jgi:hypothetical protein
MENCGGRYMKVSENNGEEMYDEKRYNFIFIQAE